MIPVLRKVAQLNIKYRKKGGSITYVCTGAPPDEVTALRQCHVTFSLARVISAAIH